MSALEEIVARKRIDVAERALRVPYETLRERAVPTRRRLGEALKKPGLRFIMECKRASPSAGTIRENFDIAEIARAYDGIADAVSVLADEPFFRGGLEYVRAARDILDVPILCKDFVIGPYQICEARAHGADAVLLMLSVLGDGEYLSCAREAARLGMDALTEVHCEAELERALSLDASIIGINSRDLRTFSVDLGVVRRLASRIPKDRVRVCESGISSREDVLGMSGDADAFLVGSLLMRSPRVDVAARRLVFGGVKICGLTSPEAAGKSYEAGACFGGLIFAGESPRRIDESAAREIADASPLPLVGVFVNDLPRRIIRLANELGLAAVQLHGEESDEFISGLRRELPRGCEIWNAVRISDGLPDGIPMRGDRTLLDAFVKNSRGGTGRSFDWSMLDGSSGRDRMIIAGGITPENAPLASKLGCYAIDVNSGVELPGAPGRKDPDRIGLLFGNLRNAI
ncbi:MAG: bifunctional indole-3-glycerol-phosphate synthase TrpC/phosphoribosylanthranilate isomerase TrpF [Synergistaceae bacterium]|nr:bifunctional indole-3-glycerol-phosphate synthase TrpC/phosphoribosylanthranilate isomerase TrpF [Synergistaceae bacterium]